MTGDRPLVIGYGNPLGADDAVGWLVAGALIGDPRARAFDVLAVHQLNPEHAVRMAEAPRVVVVDTAAGGDPPLPPGSWTVHRADGHPPVAGWLPAAEWGHRCTPLSLAALAVGLYRATSPIYLVDVGVSSLEPGERAALAVLQAVPALVELVLALASGDGPADGPAGGRVQLSGDPGIPAGRPRGGASRPA